MSLFSSLQMAGNTLQAMQIGLHVVGNNIANANTPGFVRERVIYATAPVQKIGDLTLGTGVQIAGILQSVDNFVEARLRDAGGDRASAEVQEKVYRDIQAILGELTDTDISTSLTEFFNSLDEVASNPQNIDFRNLAIGNGVTLATRVNTLDRRIREEHEDFSTRVDQIALEINTLTEQISQLNIKIVTTEGGSGSDAGGLRGLRQKALKELAELADITVNDNGTGAINISVNGEILVFEGTRREVVSLRTSENNLVSARINFADNESLLSVGGGELNGIYEARDEILGGFLDGLDNFAATLAFEFNKLYSQGQGIDGFNEVVSTAQVSDPNVTLDQAGLAFTPINGSFNLIVSNTENDGSKTHKTHLITVDLNGLDGNDTTLASLASDLNAIDGISAQVSTSNELVIRSDSQDVEFSFGLENQADDSRVLAALGINTFFTGSTASNLGVNDILRVDRQAGAKFSASLAGEPSENIENALRLSALYDESIEGLTGGSINGAYNQLLNDTTQGATVAKAIADGLRVFEGTLSASAQAVSGVNLDEEAIDMIQLQRTYQASARYIQTLAELLDMIVNL